MKNYLLIILIMIITDSCISHKRGCKIKEINGVMTLICPDQEHKSRLWQKNNSFINIDEDSLSLILMDDLKALNVKYDSLINRGRFTFAFAMDSTGMITDTIRITNPEEYSELMSEFVNSISKLAPYNPFYLINLDEKQIINEVIIYFYFRKNKIELSITPIITSVR